MSQLFPHPSPAPATSLYDCPKRRSSGEQHTFLSSGTGLSTSLSNSLHFSPPPSSKAFTPSSYKEMALSKPGANYDHPPPLRSRNKPDYNNVVPAPFLTLPSRMNKERPPLLLPHQQKKQQGEYEGHCVQYSRTCFSVSDLVKQSASLPMKTEVATPLYGVCGEGSLLDGQVVSLHFVKQTEVVNLRTRHDTSYKIPLHSSIQFAILYNPQGDINKASNGYWFQTIADVIEAKPVPLMLYVSKSSRLKNATTEQMVKEGEVIVPMSIKTKGSKPVYLKCLTIQGDEMKRLPPECTGPFTTTPVLLRLYLTQLLKHLTLPQDVIVFLSINQKNQLLVEFGSHPVSLVSQKTMLSIIGTTKPSTETAYDEETPTKVVEIASELNLEFEQLTLSSEEMERLNQHTKELFRTFSPTLVDCFVDDLAPGGHGTQTLLNSFFVDGIQGFHLHTPERAFTRRKPTPEQAFTMEQHREMVVSPLKGQNTSVKQPPPASPSLSSIPLPQKLVPTNPVQYVPPTADEEDKDDYEEPFDPPSPTRASPASTKPEYDYIDKQQRGNAVQQLYEELRKLSSNCTQLRAELDNVKRRLQVVEGQNDMLRQLQLDVKDLEVKQLGYQEFFPVQPPPVQPSPPVQPPPVQSPPVQPPPVQSPPVQPPTVSQRPPAHVQPPPSHLQHNAAADAEENRRLVRSLSSEQIMEMLKDMGMTAYMETFYREGVNGELLLELNDTILERELGIVSQYHRIKLIQVISGMQSVKKYMHH